MKCVAVTHMQCVAVSYMCVTLTRIALLVGSSCSCCECCSDWNAVCCSDLNWVCCSDSNVVCCRDSNAVCCSDSNYSITRHILCLLCVCVFVCVCVLFLLVGNNVWVRCTKPFDLFFLLGKRAYVCMCVHASVRVCLCVRACLKRVSFLEWLFCKRAPFLEVLL